MTEEIQKTIEFDYVQVGRLRIHYARAGNAPRMLVLLHGFPECWYSWRHQLADLADEFTVVAPDLRGYNLTDKPKKISDYDLLHLVDDVIGLIHNLGFENAALAGHDWGGAVAWAAAREHPGIIDRVACLQVPPPEIWKKNFSLRQLMASWYMFYFQIPWLPEKMLAAKNFEGLEKALRGTTASRGVFTDEDITAYRNAWSQPGALTGGINYYRANILKRLIFGTDVLPPIKVPTLFIYGEKDRAILPSTVEGISDVIEAEYTEVRIPDSAHWVQTEAREKVTQSLREFLNA